MSLKLWPGLVCSSAAVGEMLELIFSGAVVQKEAHCRFTQWLFWGAAATTAELPVCALGEAHLYFHPRISSSQPRMVSSIGGQDVQPVCFCFHVRSSENLSNCLIMRTLDYASRKCLVLRVSSPGWEPSRHSASTRIWRSSKTAALAVSPIGTHCKPFINGKVYCVEKNYLHSNLLPEFYISREGQRKHWCLGKGEWSWACWRLGALCSVPDGCCKKKIALHNIDREPRSSGCVRLWAQRWYRWQTWEGREVGTEGWCLLKIGAVTVFLW